MKRLLILSAAALLVFAGLYPWRARLTAQEAVPAKNAPLRSSAEEPDPNTKPINQEPSAALPVASGGSGSSAASGQGAGGLSLPTTLDQAPPAASRFPLTAPVQTSPCVVLPRRDGSIDVIDVIDEGASRKVSLLELQNLIPHRSQFVVCGEPGVHRARIDELANFLRQVDSAMESFVIPPDGRVVHFLFRADPDLQGLWQIDYLKDEDKVRPDQKVLIAVAGARFAIFQGRKRTRMFFLSVDPTRAPKWMDQIAQDKQPSMRGLYEVKGEGMRLSLTSDPAATPDRFGTERPEFKRIGREIPDEMLQQMSVREPSLVLPIRPGGAANTTPPVLDPVSDAPVLPTLNPPLANSLAPQGPAAANELEVLAMALRERMQRRVSTKAEEAALADEHAALEQAVARSFDAHQDRMRRELADFRLRLERLARQLEDREKARPKLIDRRMQQLLRSKARQVADPSGKIHWVFEPDDGNNDPNQLLPPQYSEPSSSTDAVRTPKSDAASTRKPPHVLDFDASGAPADPRSATRKGLEFLSGYPKLARLSLNMGEAEFIALINEQNLSFEGSRHDNRNRYYVSTGDGMVVAIVFQDGACTSIQRLRGGPTDPARSNSPKAGTP